MYELLTAGDCKSDLAFLTSSICRDPFCNQIAIDCARPLTLRAYHAACRARGGPQPGAAGPVSDELPLPAAAQGDAIRLVPIEIRDYRRADEQDWLRRRVLSFLSAACFDDVLTAKESPAVGADLVAVRSRAVVGVLDLSVEGAPPAREISDRPWHRCKDLHRRGRAVDRIHTPGPHQRSARPGWFAQFGVVGRLCHRPVLPL